MNKRILAGVLAGGVLLLGVAGSSIKTQVNSLDTQKPSRPATSTKITEKLKATCDGTSVTTNCVVDGASYKTYIYHPAVPEKSHTETVTTYREEVTGYCTLCNDGTYSPSCATGRGACSYHGGVAQWNAPKTSNVPVNSTNTVIDAPAQEAYYEKITN